MLMVWVPMALAEVLAVLEKVHWDERVTLAQLLEEALAELRAEALPE